MLKKLAKNKKIKHMCLPETSTSISTTRLYYLPPTTPMCAPSPSKPPSPSNQPTPHPHVAEAHTKTQSPNSSPPPPPTRTPSPPLGIFPSMPMIWIRIDASRRWTIGKVHFERDDVGDPGWRVRWRWRKLSCRILGSLPGLVARVGWLQRRQAKTSHTCRR